MTNGIYLNLITVFLSADTSPSSIILPDRLYVYRISFEACGVPCFRRRAFSSSLVTKSNLHPFLQTKTSPNFAFSKVSFIFQKFLKKLCSKLKWTLFSISDKSSLSLMPTSFISSSTSTSFSDVSSVPLISARSSSQFSLHIKYSS